MDERNPNRSSIEFLDMAFGGNAARRIQDCDNRVESFLKDNNKQITTTKDFRDVLVASHKGRS